MNEKFMVVLIPEDLQLLDNVLQNVAPTMCEHDERKIKRHIATLCQKAYEQGRALEMKDDEAVRYLRECELMRDMGYWEG